MKTFAERHGVFARITLDGVVLGLPCSICDNIGLRCCTEIVIVRTKKELLTALGY